MRQSPLELFLDRIDPDWRGDQVAFFRTVAGAGPEAVEELAGRVQKVSCPAGLRRLAIEFSFYHPWPEWTPLVHRLLRHEKDLAIFETGVRALGRIRTPDALAALRDLAQSRATPGFREAVNEVLQQSDPAGAFQHHFARLLKGSAQAGDANDAAYHLADLLTPESLEPLRTAVAHPDPLVYRHALRLVSRVPSEASAEFLLGYLEAIHADALEDREARVHLAAFRGLPPAEVLGQARDLLAARWEGRRPEVMAGLASDRAERVKASAAELRDSGLGILDAFLLDALLATLDGKPAQLARFLGQATEVAQQHTRRIDFGMEAAAQGLADLAGAGFLPAERLVPALVEPLRRNTARAGVAGALARLVPPDAQDLLDLLLDHPEAAFRGAALEGLGQRKDPAFRPALLKARRDAITDLADRALWHLGQLPDPEAAARAFLSAPDPEEVLTGLRFIAIHKLAALVPDLLDLAAAEARESVLVAALGTLGAIGSAEAVDPLLGLLHSGQAPRIQVALAEAVRDLRDISGAFALCGKAQELNAPVLQAIAVEALVLTHATPDLALPAGGSAALVRAVRGGWSDRNPWPLRRRIAEALAALCSEDQGLWAELSEILQATLAEKRPPGEVSPDDLAQLQTCARTLAQLALA